MIFVVEFTLLPVLSGYKVRLGRDNEDSGEEIFKVQSSRWNHWSKNVKKKRVCQVLEI